MIEIFTQIALLVLFPAQIAWGLIATGSGSASFSA